MSRGFEKTGTELAFTFSMAVLGDPQSFPITTDQPRSPLNWYGRSKVLAERSVKTFAAGSFPAHLFLKSNLYDQHIVNGTIVGKPTVINFFVNRAFAGKPLTVYEPGTQARNFVHVIDVARVYVRSTERLLRQLHRNETGTETYEIAGEEDMSMMNVAEIVSSAAKETLGTDLDIELVTNPRSAETMVEEFSVDTSQAREVLDWIPTESVESSAQRLLSGD